MKHLLSLLIILVYSGSIVAQVGSLRMGIQSPTAASLGEYGDVPVSLYTGIPNISIPIFEDKDVPISLSYHAGGNKVEGIASWVGLGWSLNAGGVITRTVVGKPDDSPNGYYNQGHQLYNSGNWPSPSSSLWTSMTENGLDTEPDRFFYNVMGISGQLLMSPKGISGSKIRTIPHSKMDVSYEDATQEWTIINSDGTKFIFGGTGFTEINTDYSYTYPGGIPNNIGESHVSAWYLKKVIYPQSDKEVNLYYSSYTTDREFRSYSEKIGPSQVYTYSPCVSNGTNYSNANFEIASVKLDSIVTNKHRVHFESSLRTGLPSGHEEEDEYKLNNIKVFNKAGELLNRTAFSYSYYSGYKKLRLDNIRQYGNNLASYNEHVFTYDSKSFPDPHTSEAVDYWGYYNGKNSNTSLIPEAIVEGEPFANGFYEGADRSVNSGYSDVGILKKITYPTGGFTELEFESNTYGAISNGLPDLYEYQNSLLSASVNDYGYDQETIVTTSNATLEIDVSFSNPCGGTYPGCPYVSLTGGHQYFTNTQETINVGAGTYTLTLDATSYPSDITVTVKIREKVPVKEKLGGGLRIKKVRTYANNTAEPIEKTYIYNMSDDPARSSGVIINAPKFHYVYNSTSSTCSYLSRSSISKAPLGMTSGGNVGYREVRVLHNGGNSGKEKHLFTSAYETKYDDLDFASNDIWPFFTGTVRDWRRGLNLETTYYNANDKAVSKVTNSYTFDARDYVDYRAYAFTWINKDGQVYNPYRVISEWRYMDTSAQIVIDPSDATKKQQSTTEFIYSDPSHLQLTSKLETNSDGTERVTEYEYAHENHQTAIESLNMLTQPYSVTTKDGSGIVLSKQWTLWNQFNGNWQPCGVWVWNGGTVTPPANCSSN